MSRGSLTWAMQLSDVWFRICSILVIMNAGAQSDRPARKILQWSVHTYPCHDRLLSRSWHTKHPRLWFWDVPVASPFDEYVRYITLPAINLQQITITNMEWCMIILMVSMWDVGAMTVDALQSIYNAWKNDTPDPEINLAGWESGGQFPCYNESWRGLLCWDQQRSNSITDLDVYIIGL